MTPFIHTQKQKAIISESDIDDVFKSIYTTITSNIQNILGKGSDWIVDSVIDHNINISKYNPLAGSRYTKLSKELDDPREDLINIQSIDDNESFKWCLARYLHPADCSPARITETDKNFVKKLPVKVRHIYKIGKKESHQH